MVLRTTRITVETETFLVIRHARAAVAWCPGCSAQVDVITLSPGSLAEPEVSAELDRRKRTGRLHLWHSSEGATQVCANSLLQCSA